MWVHVSWVHYKKIHIFSVHFHHNMGGKLGCIIHILNRGLIRISHSCPVTNLVTDWNHLMANMNTIIWQLSQDRTSILLQRFALPLVLQHRHHFLPNRSQSELSEDQMCRLAQKNGNSGHLRLLHMFQLDSILQQVGLF